MTAAKALLTLLHWISRHLVVLGFVLFVAAGWFWREQVWPDQSVWRGLVVALRDSEPAGEPNRNEIPKGVFRPAVPIAGGRSLEPRRLTRLEQARKAFWLDRQVEAERLYRDYLAEHPDGVEGHGELGNLLLALGRESEARSEYQETIRLLEIRGRPDEADRLRELLATRSGRDGVLAGENDRATTGSPNN